MKPRSALSASEVLALQSELDRRLDRIGVESRPEVAVRLLELSGRADAQLRDYADVVKIDHAVSGRILRLANSALFAQRTPVTNLGRACLVLGIERLRALSVGLYLSRAASAGGPNGLSRRIWGESVFRACLASEVARVVAPSLVAESFIVGLLIDAGIPLMARLQGARYEAIAASTTNPVTLLRLESELEYTHVDLAAALARRWRLPELLAKPLEWHHVRPASVKRDEPVHRLHRIAYVVGMLELSEVDSAQEEPMLSRQDPGVSAAQRMLSVSDPEMSAIIRQSTLEYASVIDLFGEIAASMGDPEALHERVQSRLMQTLDECVEESIRREERSQTRRICVAGRTIEVVRDGDGSATAYLFDSRGQKLLAHRFTTGVPSADTLFEAFGMDSIAAEEVQTLENYLKASAA